MKSLSNEDIKELVAKAFVIEAITDKPGCTTRYYDLPGKPLEDFVIAGINASRYFEVYKKGELIFQKNPPALRASNYQKSNKYINFGLLEILFPIVAARSLTSNPNKVIETTLNLMRESNNQDVQLLLECRRIAWQTSGNTARSTFRFDDYEKCASPYAFYEKLVENCSEDSSEHQWGLQYLQGLPILKEFYDSYMSSGEYMATTSQVFKRTTKKFPQVAKGIHADMCAAALFLYFSYTN